MRIERLNNKDEWDIIAKELSLTADKVLGSESKTSGATKYRTMRTADTLYILYTEE